MHTLCGKNRVGVLAVGVREAALRLSGVCPMVPAPEAGASGRTDGMLHGRPSVSERHLSVRASCLALLLAASTE